MCVLDDQDNICDKCLVKRLVEINTFATIFNKKCAQVYLCQDKFIYTWFKSSEENYDGLCWAHEDKTKNV